MADYYSVIARAVSQLAIDTPEARQELYERARKVVDAALHSREPRIPASEILRQELALEDAIRRAEEKSASLSARPAKAREEKSEKPTIDPAVSSPKAKTRRGLILSWVLISAIWCTYIAIYAHQDYKIQPPPGAPIQEHCRDIVPNQLTTIPPECVAPLPDEPFDALHTPIWVYVIIGLVPPIALFGIGAIFYWALSRSALVKEGI
jgi:hypothetical protein